MKQIFPTKKHSVVKVFESKWLTFFIYSSLKYVGNFYSLVYLDNEKAYGGVI